MAARRRPKKFQGTIRAIEEDHDHHLTGSFQPATPLGSRPNTPTFYKKVRTPSEDPFYASHGLWNDIKGFRWIRVPSSAFKLVVAPIILYFLIQVAFPNAPNPFKPLIFISHEAPTSSPDDPRYAKGPLDIVFVIYHIVVFSFVRQFALFNVLHPLAGLLGIKKLAKVERFGEQAYAVLYYGTMGLWGVLIMRDLPTWWYQTEYYFIDYPHWDMKASLKRYYLMHLSYWIQQLVIIGLKLEKPRTDYKELVAHHLVTVWLIWWSYIVNLTLIGNAVFVSMDIPDVFFAFSKLCNYLDLKRTKVVTFLVFVGIWTYFRHYQNLRILWSVWTEFDLIPASARVFDPINGVWMDWWMRYQIFTPILLLQCLNLFWYYLIMRILYRAVTGQEVTDSRSDDEGEDEGRN